MHETAAGLLHDDRLRGWQIRLCISGLLIHRRRTGLRRRRRRGRCGGAARVQRFQRVGLGRVLLQVARQRRRAARRLRWWRVGAASLAESSGSACLHRRRRRRRCAPQVVVFLRRKSAFEPRSCARMAGWPCLGGQIAAHGQQGSQHQRKIPRLHDVSPSFRQYCGCEIQHSVLTKRMHR